MNRKEALKAMIDGEKVTHYSYNFTSYIFMDVLYSGLAINRHPRNNKPLEYNLNHAGGYEIYKEPKEKKMVKLYRYLDKFGNDASFHNEAYSYIDGKVEVNRLSVPSAWIKTNCYIEVEVEVEE